MKFQTCTFGPSVIVDVTLGEDRHTLCITNLESSISRYALEDPALIAYHVARSLAASKSDWTFSEYVRSLREATAVYDWQILRS